jgi:hypothetical protein
MKGSPGWYPQSKGSLRYWDGSAWTDHVKETQSNPSTAPVVLAFGFLAFVLQAGVLTGTFMMGLGWGGPTWLAGLAQAAAGFALITWLAPRRKWWALAVPPVSAALTLALAVSSERYAEATECSDAELAAVAELSPPPGLEVELYGSVAAGCVATPRSTLPPGQVHAHYRAEFAKHGWRTASPEAEGGVAAVKDGIKVDVSAERWEGADGTVYMVYITAWDGCSDRPQACR